MSAFKSSIPHGEDHPGPDDHQPAGLSSSKGMLAYLPAVRLLPTQGTLCELFIEATTHRCRGGVKLVRITLEMSIVKPLRWDV